MLPLCSVWLILRSKDLNTGIEKFSYKSDYLIVICSFVVWAAELLGCYCLERWKDFSGYDYRGYADEWSAYFDGR